MRRAKLLRVLLTGALSAVLVFFSWVLTFFVTPGSRLANRVVSAHPSDFLGDLNEAVTIAAVVDFAVWFAALWGFQGLLSELRRMVRDQGASGEQSNSLWHSSAPRYAALCAVPLSFYVVIGMSRLWNRGGLLESDLRFATAIAFSLAACTTAICGLFVLAIRFRSGSSA